jgi:hypothetical protein
VEPEVLQDLVLNSHFTISLLDGEIPIDNGNIEERSKLAAEERSASKHAAGM